jgi:hypothetical protein
MDRRGKPAEGDYGPRNEQTGEEKSWRILSAASADLKKRPNANRKSAPIAGRRRVSKRSEH